MKSEANVEVTGLQYPREPLGEDFNLLPLKVFSSVSVIAMRIDVFCIIFGGFNVEPDYKKAVVRKDIFVLIFDPFVFAL